MNYLLNGSVRSSRTKFREITPTSIAKYRVVLSQTVALMIRFIHAHRTGHLSNLGNFKLKGSEDQAQAALNLYLLFLESKGRPTLERLRSAKHALFAALLQPPSLSDDIIACPTDQAFFLTCILPEGRYQTAKYIACLCAAAQYSFRCVFCHVVRLKAATEDTFTLWNAGEGIEGLLEDNLEIGHVDEEDSGENDDEIEDDSFEEDDGLEAEDTAPDEFSDGEALNTKEIAEKSYVGKGEFCLSIHLISLRQDPFTRRRCHWLYQYRARSIPCFRH